MNDNLVSGVLTDLAVGVRRLIAPNPGMMTGPGTNTYLLGTRELAVIDPGPKIASHLKSIADAGNIQWILVSHTHPDHSPGAMELAAMTGAKVIGKPAPDGPHQDSSFSPDQIPDNGNVLHGADFDLKMICTPGHASNHLCFVLDDLQWLFTGDHIMNGSTVVIDPPDGNMSAYLESLSSLRQTDINAIAPGHGGMIHNPYEVIDWIIDHRLEREDKVVAALANNPDLTCHDLVPLVYTDVDNALFGWAERSLLAHLIKLRADKRATENNLHWRMIEA